jgi:NTE family protein
MEKKMNKKVGIVLSGGGAKGAFELGALDVLLKKIEWAGDTLAGISGTSIGAFISAFVASGQFESLKKIWLSWNMKNCPLVQTQWYGAYGSLLLRGYMYEAQPVKDFFIKNLDVGKLLTSKTKYINTFVRLGDGELFYGGNITPNNTQDRAISEIMASMSFIPGTPSVNIDGREFVDGGFRDTVPVKALIENCEKLDKIYVINVNTEKRKWNTKILSNTNKSLIERLIFLYDDILWDENNRSDIEIGKLKFWDKEKYSVIYPLVMNQVTTSFEPDLISESFYHGKQIMENHFKNESLS